MVYGTHPVLNDLTAVHVVTTEQAGQEPKVSWYLLPAQAASEVERRAIGLAKKADTDVRVTVRMALIHPEWTDEDIEERLRDDVAARPWPQRPGTQGDGNANHPYVLHLGMIDTPKNRVALERTLGPVTEVPAEQADASWTALSTGERDVKHVVIPLAATSDSSGPWLPEVTLRNLLRDDVIELTRRGTLAQVTDANDYEHLNGQPAYHVEGCASCLDIITDMRCFNAQDWCVYCCGDC